MEAVLFVCLSYVHGGMVHQTATPQGLAELTKMMAGGKLSRSMVKGQIFSNLKRPLSDVPK